MSDIKDKAEEGWASWRAYIKLNPLTGFLAGLGLGLLAGWLFL